MQKRKIGLVNVLETCTIVLAFLNELIPFVEKVISYIHVALNYIFQRSPLFNGKVGT